MIGGIDININPLSLREVLFIFQICIVLIIILVTFLALILEIKNS